MEKAIAEQPTYVLFNGAEGAMTGDKAITAKVGESVRMFVGNGGPNLVSSFHVIGAIFDEVRYEGGSNVQRNVQTTLIPAGGAAVVKFTTKVPGSYVLVDHSIFRAFNKGALAILKVTGPEDKTIYSGKEQTGQHRPCLCRLGQDGGEASRAPRVPERLWAAPPPAGQELPPAADNDGY